MTKLWDGRFPASIRDCYSLRICLFFTNLLYPPPAPPVSTVLCISDPLPYLDPTSPPSFTLQRRFTLSLHPLLPPKSPGCGATINWFNLLFRTSVLGSYPCEWFVSVHYALLCSQCFIVPNSILAVSLDKKTQILWQSLYHILTLSFSLGCIVRHSISRLFIYMK